MLYDYQRKFADKPINVCEFDFDLYSIPQRNWRVRTDRPFVHPTAHTIANILRVLNQYGNPSSPLQKIRSSKQKYPETGWCFLPNPRLKSKTGTCI